MFDYARSPMRTAAAVLAVLALAPSCKDATESKKTGTLTPSAPAERDSGASSDGGLVPPRPDDWIETKVSKAKLKVRVPSGASVPSDRAGFDEKFVGSYFRVVMPSGYDVLFAERHGTSPTTDVAVDRLAFKAKTRDKGEVLYDAADGFVAIRDEGPPHGKHCETTACGKIGGRPICASGAGSRVDGTQVKTLTETECLAIVTIARSIQDP